MRIFSVVLAGMLAAGASLAQDKLKPFEFTPDRQQTPAPAACAFDSLKLPADFAVYATGSYSGRKIGFQIDQSGHDGTQIDVAVNSPGKPVVLMLGAYEPTVWNIGWTKGTRILAVLASGYHRQAIAGLEKNVPTLISSYDNRGPCGYFYVGSQEKLEQLNPLSRRLFNRAVDLVYPAKDGKAMVGDALPSGAQLVTAAASPPDAYYDRNAPVAGPAGLEEAAQKGLLRKATQADADAWLAELDARAPKRDVPPVAGEKSPSRRSGMPMMHRAYVVLKPFVIPSGLYGGNSATFFVPKGVTPPSGNPGHSAIYDFNTMACQGPMCRMGQ